MHWYPRYRFLLFIVLVSALAAVWEMTDPDPEESKDPSTYPSVMLELYPESTRILFTKAMVAYRENNLTEARELFERALAPGIKTDENLLYYYAMTLVRLDAEGQKVDAAINEWRRNFPHSTRPEPREAVKSGQFYHLQGSAAAPAGAAPDRAAR